MGFDRDGWDDKSIKTSDLESDASRFYSIIGEMTGHSGDVERTLTGGASHFTDMVQESIKSEAKYDADLWAKATMWCVVGAGLIREWTGYVTDFRKKLDELQTEWDEYPPPPSEDSDDDSSDLKCEVEPGVSPEMQDYLSAKQDKLNELNRKAEEALEKLEDQISKINGDLEKGPDDFVVQKLVDSGAIGWAAYSVLGVEQPVPVDFDGEQGRKHADKVADALENGDDIPPHILAALGYLNTAGLDKRTNGGKLSKEELKYLEEFYGRFDGDSETLPGGALSLSDQLTRNDDLTNGERQEVLSVLGGGLLTLSNEENGGSLERLPANVQRVVEGPTVYPAEDQYDRYYGWGAELRQLSALIAPTGDQIEGGTAFSAGLTTAIGNELHGNHLDSGLPMHEGIVGPNANDGDADGVVQSLLDVSLRNEDANHQILAGEHESLRYGNDPAKTITGIFGHDWSDRGETASKLIDWIPDAVDSDDPDVREKAAYATLGLVEHSTGVDAFGDLTQDNSVGGINPNVSMAMGEVFNRYIYDFGRGAGDGEDKFDFVIGDDEARVKDGENYLHIPIDARLKFMQLAASDDEAAQTMYKDIKMHQIESVDDYFNGNANQEETASNVGRVRGLFDTALYHEGLDSYGIEKDAAEHSVGIYNTGTDMFIDLSAGNIPVVGGGASTALKEYAGALWDGKEPEHGYLEEHLENYDALGETNANNTRLDIQLQLIHSIEATEGKVEIEEEKDDESEGKRAIFLDDNGEFARISQDIPTGVRESRIGDANDLLEAAGHPNLADNYFNEWKRTYDDVMDNKRTGNEEKYIRRYNPTHE